MSVSLECLSDSARHLPCEEHLIIHYRLLFVLLVLPVSLVYDLWFSLRRRLVLLLHSSPSNHREKVAALQRQVREYQARGETRAMAADKSVWAQESDTESRAKVYPVKINLVDILHIDISRRVVVCEPLVTMGLLMSRLDRLGWTLPVVPELDSLTVGGLVMGAGIETSSHRRGLFQHICRSYELVLADGSLVECSAQSDPDLFYSIPWSYGTIGFLTRVDIEIVPSRRFVKLDYIPVYSLEQMVETMERELERPDSAQLVECLMYGKDRAVVMTGNMIDCCHPDKLNEIGLWHKPWFYKHVQVVN